jgi:hypothetical protein
VSTAWRHFLDLKLSRACDHWAGGSDARDGVGEDKARSMQLMQEGARLGCAHSKGILGGCFLFGEGVERDEVRGSALLKDSVAAGSCYGQCVRLLPLHPPPTAACDALLLQVRACSVSRAADRSCGGVRGRIT